MIFLNTNLTSRQSDLLIFFLLALSGLFLRGLYLFEYSHFVNFDLAIGADVGEYWARSQEILKGTIFPASPEIHAPYYSFFLAGMQKIGLTVPGIRIFQTLLNYFSWLGLFFLLLKSNIPKRICFVFLGISMFLAPLVFHPAELVSESILLPLLSLTFFFFHFAENLPSRRKVLFAVPSGIFAGAAFLTHGMLSGFLVLETFYLLWRKKYLTALAFTAGVVLVVTPFLTAKNLHYGQLTGVQGNTAFNIFLGNNPRANGLCYVRPGNIWRAEHFRAEVRSRERKISTNHYWMEKTLSFWQKTPFKAIGLYLKKIPLIFSSKEYIAGADGGFLFCRTDSMNILRFFTFPVFLLSFAGIWYLWKKKEYLWAPALILSVSLFLMQLLTVTSGRYRFLMFPGVIYLAAIGAVYLNWNRWKVAAGVVFLLCVWQTYNFIGFDKAEGTALLGQAHFIKGNYEHAKELLLFANKRFRDSSRIGNMLGNIAEKEGNFPLARQYYTDVTRKEPFMPEGWMNLANVTSAPEQADRFFRRALEAAAPSPGADLTFNYARFLYASKRYDEALKFLEKTFAIEPNHIPALNLSGIIAAGQKDFSRAAALFYKAATAAPEEAGYWKNTVITARLAGNRALEEKAIKKYQQLQYRKKLK